MKANRVIRGVMCAAAGGIAWGFSGSCAQVLLDSYGVSALWLTCVRMQLSALLFLALALVLDRRNLAGAVRDKRSVVDIVLFGLFGVALMQVCYLSAIQHTSAGTATVVMQVGLALIMLVVCVQTRRLPRAREVAGLLCAIVGVFIIATQGNPLSLSMSPEGLFWSLITAACNVLYALLPVRVLNKWGSIVVTALAMTLGAAVMTVIVRPWETPVPLDLGFVGALAAIVLIGTAAAYLLYMQGVKDAGPVKASLMCCMEPLSATVITAVWLGTAVTGWDALGCVIILAMVFLVTQRDSASDEESAAHLPSAFGAGGIVASAYLGASAGGWCTSRVAVREDTPLIRAMLEDGRAMAASFGAKEGAKRYPSARRLARAIAAGEVRIVEDAAGTPLAMYALSREPDKNYEKAEGLPWLFPGEPYAVLAWVSVSSSARRHGVGHFITADAHRLAQGMQVRSVRADVDPANDPMRSLLAKDGFTEVGRLSIRDYLGARKVRAVYEKAL